MEHKGTFHAAAAATIAQAAIADALALKARVAELQTTPGAITEQDQVLLDDIQARAGRLALRLDALLDFKNSPPPPTDIPPEKRT